jgi:hypothetical protein
MGRTLMHYPSRHEISTVNDTLLPTSVEDRAIIECAARWLPHVGLKRLSQRVLQNITRSRNIDFATAVAYERVMREPMHARCAKRIETILDAPVQRTDHPCAIGIRPMVDSEGRKHVDEATRDLESVLRKQGHTTFRFNLEPLGDMRENAARICNTLLERPEERIVVASVSKGGADIKLAMNSPAGEKAFQRVVGWLNVCGVLDGSDLPQRILDEDENVAVKQVKEFYRNMNRCQYIKLLHNLRQMNRGSKGCLSGRLRLPSHVTLFNVIGFPLEEHFNSGRVRGFHKLLSEFGPNDGFVLLSDLINKPGYILPIWGSEHRIDRFVDSNRLAAAALRFLDEEGVTHHNPVPPPQRRLTRDAEKCTPLDPVCGAPAGQRRPSTACPASELRHPGDSKRLRHARERHAGFAVGRYLQPAPMLFTRDGHNLFLGDLYRGRSAFLIGGGPSLKKQNLSLLEQRGVLTCAMNNVAAVYRPHLWVSVDDPGSFSDVIWQDPAILKFVPLCHMEKKFSVRDSNGALMESSEVVGDVPGIFGFRRNEHFEASQWLYEDTFNWGNHARRKDAEGNKGSRSVMYVGLRLLFYLGVRRIFLLGCDFRMQDGQANYSFEQARSPQSVGSNNKTYQILNSRLSLLKPHFEREGLEIYNCTPDSGLNVFPSMDYRQAVAEATSEMPTLIDTAGMYDRRKNKSKEVIADERKIQRSTVAANSASSRKAVKGRNHFEMSQLTLVVAVDRRHLEKLRLTWPTWMQHKPELKTVHTLIIHDDSLNPEGDEVSFLRDHPELRFVPWSMPEAQTQRERMLTALVKVPAQEVQTKWYLNLDADVVATAQKQWLDQRWFEADDSKLSPAFISSPWGYTKPADTIDKLDSWGDRIPGLKEHAPLKLPRDPDSSLVRHHRIISWCFFGNTAWTREMAAFAPGRLPCPSQDTYLTYCALRRRDPFRRIHMAQYGWRHVSGGLNRLRRLCTESLW